MSNTPMNNSQVYRLWQLPAETQDQIVRDWRKADRYRETLEETYDTIANCDVFFYADGTVY